MLRSLILARSAPQSAILLSSKAYDFVRIGGLVVEYSPATRVTRVRFPVDAQISFLFFHLHIGLELNISCL
jgi:hypothetical protein